MKNQNGQVTVGDMPLLMVKLNAFNSMFNEEEIAGILNESHADLSNEIDFEAFLKVSHLVSNLVFCWSHSRRPPLFIK